MSLDDTLVALAQFSAGYARFNETLRASYRELRDYHEAIDPIWRDEARNAYDRGIAELEQRLAAYLRGEAEQYEEFIRQKARQLDSYLHGS